MDIIEYNTIDNDYVMYILINEILIKDTNKMIIQSCNGVSKMIKILETTKPSNYKHWMANYETKIILKATDDILLQCINLYSNIEDNIYCQYTIDIGQTEKRPFLITTVIFTPMPIKDTPEIISQLRNL